MLRSGCTTQSLIATSLMTLALCGTEKEAVDAMEASVAIKEMLNPTLATMPNSNSSSIWNLTMDKALKLLDDETGGFASRHPTFVTVVIVLSIVSAILFAAMFFVTWRKLHVLNVKYTALSTQLAVTSTAAVESAVDMGESHGDKGDSEDADVADAKAVEVKLGEGADEDKRGPPKEAGGASMA